MIYQFEPEEKEFMDYLDELIEVPEPMPNYSLLLYKGDRIAFDLGLREYLNEKKEEENTEEGEE